MKKYKVVGMPQMHLGGPWHPHPHGKLKKNKPRKQKKQRGSKTDPVGLKDGIISDGGQDVSTPTPALTEDD
ncbi:MAG: hypothetical protein KAQ85_11955, partial [Thermodesulfovibrionia bacterium]|nr:hypothetical protein [Thermodesulfovibrionia bacterium]